MGRHVSETCGIGLWEEIRKVEEILNRRPRILQEWLNE
jgi:hypothetical protein